MKKFNFLGNLLRKKFVMSGMSGMKGLNGLRADAVNSDSQPTVNRQSRLTSVQRHNSVSGAKVAREWLNGSTHLRVWPLKLVSVLAILLTLGVGNVWGANAPVNTVLWSENFAHFGTSKPSVAGTNTGTGGGTVIYDGASISYLESSTSTKAYSETLAGGTSPELLLAKGRTTWTISGIKTGNASVMTLTFKSNYASYASVSTSESTKLAVAESSAGTWTISVKAGQTAPTTFNLIITNTQGSGNKNKNIRLDDVELKVTTAGGGGDCSNQVTITNSATTSVSHGSFDVDKTGSQDACSALSVTVTPDPDDHYHVASVSATNPATSGTAGAAVDNGDGTYTITYSANAKGNSAISVTFEEDTHYTVTWMSNGSQHTTTEVYSGEKPTFPSNPSSCDGTSTAFYGWATAEWTGKIASLAGKTVHASNSTMDAVTANGTTFYAVFAKAGAGGAGEKIEINPSNSELPAAGSYNASATSFTIDGYEFKHNNWCKSANPPSEFNIQAKKDIGVSVYNVDPFENYIDHIIIYQTGTARAVTITGSYYYDSDEAEEAGDTFEEEEITAPSTAATMSFDFTGKNHRYFYMSTPGNAVYMDSIVVYTRSSITYSDYLTTCCDNNVTLADGSPTNGTVTFSPAGPIATCSATASDRTTTMTITPNAGYYLSNFTPSGVSTSNSPSIATSGSTSESAQEISLEFAQNTTSGTYTAGATFSAKPLTNITLAEGSVTVYVDEIKYVDVTYNPTDIITKGFSTVATPSFCKIDTYDSYNKMKVTGGRAGVTISENKTETVTIKATADNTKTTSIDVTVKPLPTILFVDLIHNKVDFAIDGTGYTAATGVLSSTVTDGVVNHSKRTPTHADVVAPVGGNTCETTHLHLIGWIRSDNAAVAAYMEGTGDAPDDDDITGAGEGYFFKPDALINTETYNGKTFYAVWGKAD